MSEPELIAWYSTAQAAKLLGISSETVRRLGREGRLGILRIEGVNGARYRGEDVRALMANGFTPAKSGSLAQVGPMSLAPTSLKAALA